MRYPTLQTKKQDVSAGSTERLMKLRIPTYLLGKRRKLVGGLFDAAAHHFHTPADKPAPDGGTFTTVPRSCMSTR